MISEDPPELRVSDAGSGGRLLDLLDRAVTQLVLASPLPCTLALALTETLMLA